MSGIVVLVCGGRNYTNALSVGAWLGGIHKQRRIDLIIEGGQRTRDPATRRIVGGADWLAGEFGRWARIPVAVYPADWDMHGKAAGPIRNQLMLDEGRPDLVVAFPGGTGTADMVAKARAAGVEVLEIDS